LNGELNVKQGSELEASSEEELDFSSSLAQLQLLLLQLISAQDHKSSNFEQSGFVQAVTGEINTKLAGAANELFQLVSNLMQGLGKPSELKSSMLNVLVTIKTTLANAAVMSTSMQDVQPEESIGAGVQQILPYLNQGGLSRSVNRKPI